MMNEIWRDIKDYEGLYQVSNIGNVKSLCNNFSRKEKILKPYKIKGYLFVHLSKNGKTKHYLIHRLVAEHFIENSNNKPYIDHINTDKTDNRICNLRWCTTKENNNNPITKDKHIKSLLKPIIQFTKNGEFIRKWDSALDVQRELGINKGNICQCCKGNLKSSGGYIWKYVN